MSRPSLASNTSRVYIEPLQGSSSSKGFDGKEAEKSGIALIAFGETRYFESRSPCCLPSALDGWFGMKRPY
jgi:hypothetical protein